MKSLSLFLLLFTTMAAQAATLPPTWKVAHVSGPLPASEAKVLLTVDSDHLSFEDKKHRPLLQIAASQINDIVYSTTRFNRTKQVGFSLSDYQYCGQGCGAIFLFNVAALMIAAPFHGHSHYVTVNWTDNGVDQEILFETGKNDLMGLTDECTRVTGIPYAMDAYREEAEAILNRQRRTSPAAVAIHRCGPEPTLRIG